MRYMHHRYGTSRGYHRAGVVEYVTPGHHPGEWREQKRKEETDALNEIENVGWPRVMDQWMVRNRIAGGSSSTWHGRCAPFDEIDLQFRNWVSYSGWPFEIGDLIPYFDRGANYLGIGAGSWTHGRSRLDGIGHQQPKLGLDQDKLMPMFWQFSRDPINRYDAVRFGRHLTARDLGSNVTLVTNATVLRIKRDRVGRRRQIGGVRCRRRAPVVAPGFNSRGLCGRHRKCAPPPFIQRCSGRGSGK